MQYETDNKEEREVMLLMPSLILVYYYLLGKIIVLCFLKKQYAQKYSDFIILKQQHM